MSDGFTDARYQTPNLEYLNKERKNFQKMKEWFASYLGVSPIHIHVDWKLVDNISTRVHQRRDYYWYFHGRNLHQSRQVALRVYWILRYRPIRLHSSAPWNKDYDVNVYFAFYAFFAQALGEFIADRPKEIQNSVTNKILEEHGDDYIRAFSEYDISKEAMMLISGSLKSIVQCEIKNCS